MVEMDERDLLASLKGYLEELKESGVEEIPFGEETPAAEVPEARPAQAAAAPLLKGAGNDRARLLFVWGGPELSEPSQDLLNRMIGAMGFADDVYLLSFLPEQDAAGLREALLARISAVAPEIVVALGESAAQVITRKVDAVAKQRGRFLKFGKMQLLVTLHPDQLVADEGLKPQVWQEMKQVMGRLNGQP